MAEKNKGQLIHEIGVYLIFGVLTTVVSMGTYFGLLWVGSGPLGYAEDSVGMYVVRVVAQILQWALAVVFAFFTNKKWVFKNADPNASTWKQLLIFAGSRVVTFGLDTVLTLGIVWILQATDYEAVPLGILNIDLTADIIAKLVASVVVVITNYVISKLFVFGEAKDKTISD